MPLRLQDMPVVRLLQPPPLAPQLPPPHQHTDKHPPRPARDAVAPAGPLEGGGTDAKVCGSLLEAKAKLRLQVLKRQLAPSTQRPVG
jgi:hypothetical protein